VVQDACLTDELEVPDEDLAIAVVVP
jgi:hypothetical protein